MKEQTRSELVRDIAMDLKRVYDKRLQPEARHAAWIRVEINTRKLAHGQYVRRDE